MLLQKSQKNFIISQVEEEELREQNKIVKRASQFLEEIDSEWEDFITRRKEELPELPKIEHHGHGHGHDHGHGHGKIRNSFTL